LATSSISCHRKVDVRLPGKGNSHTHGARPVHLIIMMIKWIRTGRLSIKNSLGLEGVERLVGRLLGHQQHVLPGSTGGYNYCNNVSSVPASTFGRREPRLMAWRGRSSVVLNLRTTTSQKCEAVPMRARI